MRPSSARLLNILVPVKRAVDYAVKIRVNPQQTGIDLNVKHSMNPFDEIAVEEAVRIRERLAKDGSLEPVTITALTIGPAKSVETLRTALAMGADSAIHVEIPESAPAPEPLGVAKAIRALIDKQEQVDIVILGKQSIDDDLGQTGQMLAGLLNWGQATFASKIDLDLGQKTALVTREIDGGHEQVRVKFPLIVTTDLQPRYASLPNIMKAKKKPVRKFKPEDLGVSLEPQMETVKVTEPPKRVGGTKVESVDELVEKLKAAGFTAV
ncbi:hypothetical protein D9757_008903 [Collybiopsis confluens]|uniref:Probable electron transfer flavoprotein subunit beta n=1 Tax=Collybiopsis confluens TaxID=2823264 RepID=A0A8H5H523_9AGAR|nr:hypothetical protein D9757_008903 [Collybiopsis confluens]